MDMPLSRIEPVIPTICLYLEILQVPPCRHFALEHRLLQGTAPFQPMAQIEPVIQAGILGIESDPSITPQPITKYFNLDVHLLHVSTAPALMHATITTRMQWPPIWGLAFQCPTACVPRVGLQPPQCI